MVLLTTGTLIYPHHAFKDKINRAYAKYVYFPTITGHLFLHQNTFLILILKWYYDEKKITFSVCEHSLLLVQNKGLRV